MKEANPKIRPHFMRAIARIFRIIYLLPQCQLWDNEGHALRYSVCFSS